MPYELLSSASLRLGAVTDVVLSAFVFRALPLVVVFFASASTRWTHKIVALFAYTAACCAGARYSSLRAEDVLFAYGYVFSVSLVPYFVARRVPRLATFCLVFALFVVLPGLRWHQHLILLVLGWELALSAYSYLVDAAADSRSLESYWFFLFVNPTVAYPRRGTKVGDVEFNGHGLLRAGRGLVAIAASSASRGFGAEIGRWEPGILGTAAHRAFYIAGIYCAHVGLASMQIGLFRQFGFVVPERYRRPYAARSPRDFWARWNTYVGTWVRLYLFDPIARLLLARRGRPRVQGRTAVRAISVVGAFAAIGALHDLLVSLVKWTVKFDMTLWFAANGVVLLAWDALAPSTPRGRTSLPFRTVSSLAMIGVIFGFAAALP